MNHLEVRSVLYFDFMAFENYVVCKDLLLERLRVMISQSVILALENLIVYRLINRLFRAWLLDGGVWVDDLLRGVVGRVVFYFDVEHLAVVGCGCRDF